MPVYCMSLRLRRLNSHVTLCSLFCMFSLRLGGHTVCLLCRLLMTLFPTRHQASLPQSLHPTSYHPSCQASLLPSLPAPITAITARHRDLSNTPYLKADIVKQYIGRGTSLDSKRTDSGDGILVDDECTTQLRMVKVSVRVALRRACARYVAVPTTTSRNVTMSDKRCPFSRLGKLSL